MEDNKPAVIEDPTTDLTANDLVAIDMFVNDGTPGLSSIDEVKMTRIMDLYLSGKTYRQISTTLRVNKSLVLYLSNRFKWFTMRQEYLADLEQSIRGRLIEAKIVNQDFLLQLQHMWQKKIGNSINKYLATDNEDHVNAIDLKEVDKYLKTVEMLHRLTADPKEGGQKAPLVGLNMGDGVTITKSEDGSSVEITPKQKVVSDMLKQFADLKRAEEKDNKR